MHPLLWTLQHEKLLEVMIVLIFIKIVTQVKALQNDSQLKHK